MIDLKGQVVLVISPHQDDLEIGCGGLVQKFLKEGSEVHVIHGTLVDLNGVYHKYDKVTGSYATYTGADRFEETKMALSMLGDIKMHEPLFASDKHHKLDTIPLSERIMYMERAVSKINPTVLLVTAVSSNQDHEALNRTVRSIMRPHFYSGVVLEYEIGDEQDFDPNLYITLSSEELDTKLKAFAQYHTQQSGELHMVSNSGMKAKAEYRGKQCYHQYAEAYKILRMVK